MGSGWLGFPLARHFVSLGNRVKASTTTPARLAELEAVNVEPFLVDIGSSSGIPAGFLQADVLIINIPGKAIDHFRRLLREVEKSPIKKILFVGSTSVYPDTNGTVTESAGVANPESPLMLIESLFRGSHQVETTIVRFGGLIGDGRHPGRFFRPGRAIRNPDAYVNLIHGDDCIGIIAQIVQREVWGEVFNCCADTHPTRREFYTHAAKDIGAPPPECIEADVQSFKIISNEKVKRTLNYRFLHPDLMKIEF